MRPFIHFLTILTVAAIATHGLPRSPFAILAAALAVLAFRLAAAVFDIRDDLRHLARMTQRGPESRGLGR